MHDDGQGHSNPCVSYRSSLSLALYVLPNCVLNDDIFGQDGSLWNVFSRLPARTRVEILTADISRLLPNCSAYFICLTLVWFLRQQELWLFPRRLLLTHSTVCYENISDYSVLNFAWIIPRYHYERVEMEFVNRTHDTRVELCNVEKFQIFSALSAVLVFVVCFNRAFLLHVHLIIFRLNNTLSLYRSTDNSESEWILFAALSPPTKNQRIIAFALNMK